MTALADYPAVKLAWIRGDILLNPARPDIPGDEQHTQKTLAAYPQELLHESTEDVDEWTLLLRPGEVVANATMGRIQALQHGQASLDTSLAQFLAERIAPEVCSVWLPVDGGMQPRLLRAGTLPEDAADKPRAAFHGLPILPPAPICAQKPPANAGATAKEALRGFDQALRGASARSKRFALAAGAFFAALDLSMYARARRYARIVQQTEPARQEGYFAEAVAEALLDRPRSAILLYERGERIRAGGVVQVKGAPDELRRGPLVLACVGQACAALNRWDRCVEVLQDIPEELRDEDIDALLATAQAQSALLK